jgi:hypothetical protein
MVSKFFRFNKYKLGFHILYLSIFGLCMINFLLVFHLNLIQIDLATQVYSYYKPETAAQHQVSSLSHNGYNPHNELKLIIDQSELSKVNYHYMVADSLDITLNLKSQTDIAINNQLSSSSKTPIAEIKPRIIKTARTGGVD